jgi:hypothetical protein
MKNWRTKTSNPWFATRAFERKKWGQKVVLSPNAFIVSGYNSLSGPHRPALLEAFSAKYRTPLCWPERHSGLLAAL